MIVFLLIMECKRCYQSLQAGCDIVIDVTDKTALWTVFQRKVEGWKKNVGPKYFEGRVYTFTAFSLVYVHTKAASKETYTLLISFLVVFIVWKRFVAFQIIVMQYNKIAA